MGCATAFALAARGARDVVVLERAVPGAEASSAAAGMLAAQVEAGDAGTRAVYVAARDAYPAFADELRVATGLDIGWRRSGALALARTEEELARLEALVHDQRAQGLPAELLDTPARVASLEPEISPLYLGAAHYPDEAQVDPPRLLRALVAAVARAGVRIRSGTSVASLVVERDTCRGVLTERGETIHADVVVLAAGSWSSLVPGVPASLPKVRPVRGQLAQLDERPPALRSIAFDGHAYVVPRGDGRVVCGATTEHVGHRREVTAGGVQQILASAIAIAPSLANAELTSTWSSFRPRVERASGETDALVGRSPVPGLFLATGHYRNGILLAKATGDAVAAEILSSS